MLCLVSRQGYRWSNGDPARTTGGTQTKDPAGPTCRPHCESVLDITRSSTNKVSYYLVKQEASDCFSPCEKPTQALSVPSNC